jgi:hypothetical protein
MRSIRASDAEFRGGARRAARTAPQRVENARPFDYQSTRILNPAASSSFSTAEAFRMRSRAIPFTRPTFLFGHANSTPPVDCFQITL